MTADDKNAIAIFIKKIYIVKELKTKIFLSNDIFDSEQISINVEKQVLIIDSCKNIKIQFNVTNTNSSIKRIARVNEIIKISVKSITTISFKLRSKDSLFIERDFMFTSSRIEQLDHDENVLFHIIDAHTEIVQIHNINSKDVYIFKNTRFEFVQKYEKKNCYLVNAKYAHLAVNVLWNNCNMHNVGGKVVVFLLSRRQSARYGLASRLCGSASPFWSRYPDSSPMWRFKP